MTKLTKVYNMCNGDRSLGHSKFSKRLRFHRIELIVQADHPALGARMRRLRALGPLGRRRQHGLNLALPALIALAA